MDACVIICRSHKPINRQDKILFIDAKNEVTRKNAESYLEPKHIQKISDTYFEYKEVEKFSKIVAAEEILQHNAKLSVALYVKNNSFADSEYFNLDEITDELFAQMDVENDAVDKLLKML